MSSTITTVTRSAVEFPDGNPAARLGARLPAEGENGVFSQTWFPVCLSSEVAAGQITVFEDKDILNTIHYHPGALTRGDTTLSRYLDFVRRYPRAHLSAAFIR